MLHDDIMSKTTAARSTSVDDRRGSDRVPFPAEVSLVWHCSFNAIHRYRMLDASNGGFRIRSAVPILEGTTGMVLRLLPKGEKIEKSVIVAWCRPDDETDGFQL